MLTNNKYAPNPENWLNAAMTLPYATPVQVSNQINDQITSQTKDRRIKELENKLERYRYFEETSDIRLDIIIENDKKHRLEEKRFHTEDFVNVLETSYGLKTTNGVHYHSMDGSKSFSCNKIKNFKNMDLNDYLVNLSLIQGIMFTLYDVELN